MNCKEVRKWISPYLDSELGSTKTFEVSEHLRICEECAARFESERRADELVRVRLAKDTMPDELWANVAQAVSAPAWMHVLRTRRYWAIAACLVVALAGVTLVRSIRSTGHDPLIVQQFASETPGNKPFAVTEPELGSARLDAFLRDTLGVTFSAGADMVVMGHTRFQVVSTANRVDANGREYVEVRLNCCGEPMLLVLAKSTGGTWPLALDQLADVQPGRLVRSFDGVNIGVRDLGGVRAVVTSRHPIQHILGSLSRSSA